MIRRDRKRSARLRELVGACPHCSRWRPGGDPAVVYRTSRTSVTMRCKTCGLQWTMTFHQLRKMSESSLEILQREVEREEIRKEEWRQRENATR